MKIATCCAHDHHSTLSHPVLLRCAVNIDLNPAFSRPSLIIYPQTGEGSPLQGSLRVSGPVSRILSRAAIHLGSASPQTSSGQPGGIGRAALQHLPIRPCTGWGLPGRRVATTPVRSYRTISPLQPVLYGSRRAVYFCGTFPEVSLAGCYPAPCSMVSGLSSEKSSSPPASPDSANMRTGVRPPPRTPTEALPAGTSL